MPDAVAQPIIWFGWFVLVYFLVLNSRTLLSIIGAARQTAHSRLRVSEPRHDDVFANPATPPISVIVPTYNDDGAIVESVRSLRRLRYPHMEVVVVDDGSTDTTFHRLRNEFRLVEVPSEVDEDVTMRGAITSKHVSRDDDRVVVIRKVNTGTRADALNAGLNAARHRLVCCVDVASVLSNDALLRIARPFVDDPERVVAATGSVRAIDRHARAIHGPARRPPRGTRPGRPTRWFRRVQRLEDMRTALVGLTASSRFGSLLPNAGVFGLYRRDLLLAVGGFDSAVLGGEIDAVLALRRHERSRRRDGRIVHVPDTVCWTDLPTRPGVVARKRAAESLGLAQLLWKHRAMMFNPKYGRTGVISMPSALTFELITPFVEIIGLAAVIAAVVTGVATTQFVVLLGVVVLLYSVLLSIAAMLVEEIAHDSFGRWRDLVFGFVAAVLENLGYRQVQAWWRISGLISLARRRAPTWGPGDPTRSKAMRNRATAA